MHSHAPVVRRSPAARIERNLPNSVRQIERHVNCFAGEFSTLCSRGAGMLRTSAFLTLTLLYGRIAAAQNMPLVEEKSTRVSDHVYAIMGFPNIAIIVGNRATLVVDTGLGPRNGAT